MQRFLMVIAALALLVIFCGCTYQLGRIPLVINSADEIPEGYVKVEDKAVGRHIQHRLFTLLPLGEFPKVSKAVDDALHGDRDKLMRNVDVYYKFIFIPLVYGNACYEVTGEVWQKKETLDAGGTEGH